jgi:hypothetical protein
MGSAPLIAVAGARWLHGDARNLVSKHYRKLAWPGSPGAPGIYRANHFGGGGRSTAGLLLVTHLQPAAELIGGYRLIQVNAVLQSPWLSLHNGPCPGRAKTPNQ